MSLAGLIHQNLWLEKFPAVSDAPEYFDGKILARAPQGGVKFGPFLQSLKVSNYNIKQVARGTTNENAYVYATFVNGPAEVSDDTRREVLKLQNQNFAGGELVQRDQSAVAINLGLPHSRYHDASTAVHLSGNKVMIMKKGDD